MAVSNRRSCCWPLVAVGLAWWDMMDVASSVVQDRRRSATEQVAVRALRDSVRTLGLQVRTAAVRDRVDSAVASYGSESTPEVVVIGREAPAAAAVAESLFATVPVPTNPAYRWRFVTVESPSTPRWPGGTLTSFAILPSADRGCLHNGRHRVSKGQRSDQYERKVLARHAVRRGGWTMLVSRAVSMHRARRSGRGWMHGTGMSRGAFLPTTEPLVYSGRDLAGAGVLDRVFGNVAVDFYRESVTLEGCAGRRPELCEESFLGSNDPPGLLPDGIVGNNRFTSYLIYQE